MNHHVLIEQLEAVCKELDSLGSEYVEAGFKGANIVSYELRCLYLSIERAKETGDPAELKLCLASSRYFVFHFRTLKALDHEKKAA